MDVFDTFVFCVLIGFCGIARLCSTGGTTTHWHVFVLFVAAFGAGEIYVPVSRREPFLVAVELPYVCARGVIGLSVRREQSVNARDRLSDASGYGVNFLIH